jgi:hypothetical protein
MTLCSTSCRRHGGKRDSQTTPRFIRERDARLRGLRVVFVFSSLPGREKWRTPWR